PATDRDGDVGFAQHGVLDAPRRVGQRLVVVESLGSAEVEVRLIDRCGLDEWCEALEDGAYGATLLAAELAWNRDDLRLGTQPERARRRHAGANPVHARFVGRGRDDAALVRSAADKQQPLAACAVGIG